MVFEVVVFMVSVSKMMINSGFNVARIAQFALAALALLALSACGRKTAPDATMVLLDGSKYATANMQGKVTFVNFWATSCVTCVAEMPELVETHKKYAPRGYDTVAVAMQYDPPSYVVNFVQTRQLPFKVAIDNTGAVAKAWGDVKITPTSFLVDKQGRIVKTYVGQPDFKALHAEIDRLLQAS
jgi:peroxiredoxin